MSLPMHFSITEPYSNMSLTKSFTMVRWHLIWWMRAAELISYMSRILSSRVFLSNHGSRYKCKWHAYFTQRFSRKKKRHNHPILEYILAFKIVLETFFGVSIHPCEARFGGCRKLLGKGVTWWSFGDMEIRHRMVSRLIGRYPWIMRWKLG